MTRDKQILAAAAKLFYERGFHAVRVDDIGAAAGVTGPAIYRHFGGKDELLATLYNEALDELFQRIGPPREDPAEELEALIRAQTAFALGHREQYRIYTRADTELAEPWRDQVRRRTRQLMDRWIGALERAYPGRTKDEITSAAFATVGLLNSVAHWPRNALRTEQLDDLLHDLVTKGLASLEEPARAARRAPARD